MALTEASPKELLLVVGMIVEGRADDGPVVIVESALDKLEVDVAVVLDAVKEITCVVFENVRVRGWVTELNSATNEVGFHAATVNGELHIR